MLFVKLHNFLTVLGILVYLKNMFQDNLTNLYDL